MKCKKCGYKIGFKYYLIETLNITNCCWHTCPNCKTKYKVNVYFWFWLILLIMGLRIYRYWMRYTYNIFVSLQNRIIVSIIASCVMIIIFLLEQILFYIKKSL